MIKIIKISVFVILMIGILSILLSCNSLKAADDSILTEETIAPVATTDILGIKTEQLGQEVTAGDIVWKVMNVNDQGPGIVSTDNYTFEATLGKFIIIDFMIRNDSAESRMLYDLKVIDRNGRVYTLCLPAYAYIPSEDVCALVEILPGLDQTFTAPFDVSPDSEDLILEVTDLQTPPAVKAYIDLGI